MTTKERFDLLGSKGFFALLVSSYQVHCFSCEKLIGKAKPFNGDEVHWDAESFKFRAATRVLTTHAATYTETAGNLDVPIASELLGTPGLPSPHRLRDATFLPCVCVGSPVSFGLGGGG